MPEQEEIQRVYTVPLARAWITARHRRTRRAVNILREFAEHHMKSSEIKIDTELNEFMWKRGITKPPRRITVKMEKDEDGLVTISLPKETKKKKEDTPVKQEETSTPATSQAAATTQAASLVVQPSSTSPVKATPQKRRPKKSAKES